MFGGLSTGLCRIRASPWVVEAQVVAPVPALALRAGVNLAFQATKKTPRLCAEVSDFDILNASSKSFDYTLTGWLFGVRRSAPSAHV